MTYKASDLTKLHNDAATFATNIVASVKGTGTHYGKRAEAYAAEVRSIASDVASGGATFKQAHARLELVAEGVKTLVVNARDDAAKHAREVALGALDLLAKGIAIFA